MHATGIVTYPLFSDEQVSALLYQFNSQFEPTSLVGKTPGQALRNHILKLDADQLPKQKFPDTNLLYDLTDSELLSLPLTSVRNALIWILVAHQLHHNDSVYEPWNDVYSQYEGNSYQSGIGDSLQIKLTSEDLRFLTRLIQAQPQALSLLNGIEALSGFVDGYQIDMTSVRNDVLPAVRTHFESVKK